MSERPAPDHGTPEELLAWCRLAFEHTPIGISFISIDRRPLAVNPAMCEILGRTEAEVMVSTVNSLTHPEDRELHLEPHRRLMAGEIDRYRIEKRYLRPDGPAVWVALHVVLIRDEAGEPEMMISQCEDISELVAAQEKLRGDRNRFAALVNRSSDLMLLVRSTGHIAYASPASERVWGYPSVAVQGVHFADFIHPDDLGRVAADIARTADAPGSSMVIECRVIDFSGGHRHIEATASNWLDEPDVDGLVINVRDVTERVAVLEQLTWQASHDTLTGLANRAEFLARLDARLATDGHDASTAVLYLDIDHFKQVNDQYGHAAGDYVLTALGHRLAGLLGPEDLAARLGGDEFVVLVHPTGLDGAVALATKVAEELAQPLTLPDGAVIPGVHLSIGVAAAQDQPASVLLQQADQALYEAKRSGAAHAVFD